MVNSDLPSLHRQRFATENHKKGGPMGRQFHAGRDSSGVSKKRRLKFNPRRHTDRTRLICPEPKTGAPTAFAIKRQ